MTLTVLVFYYNLYLSCTIGLYALKIILNIVNP